MGTGVLSWGRSGCGVKFTTNLHLVTGLSMSGAIPLLPLYTFMARAAKTLPFYYVPFFQSATSDFSIIQNS